MTTTLPPLVLAPTTVRSTTLLSPSFVRIELAGDQVVIDAAYVRERVEEIATNDDISNFIL